MPVADALHDWLRQYKRERGDKTKPSHTLLNAKDVGYGSLLIPDDQLPEFYRRYAQHWMDNGEMYVIERATERFPLYFDLDMMFQHGTVIDNHQLFITLQTIHLWVVSVFQPTSETTMYIASSGTNEKTKGDQLLTKCGMHVFWPTTIVNKQILAATRRFLVDKLQNDDEIKCLGLQNDWSDVIDEAVVKSPSCRMFGSSKLETCDCAKKKIRCRHTGHQINVKHIYKMVGVLDVEANNTDYDPLDYFTLLTKCSLRLPNDTPLAEYSLDIDEPPPKRAKNTQATTAIANQATTDFIANSISLRDSKSITEISVDVKSHIITVNLNSHYCRNKHDNHNGNNTSISLLPSGFATRICFCNCCTTRSCGVHCKNYSTRMRIPRTTRQLLFEKNKGVMYPAAQKIKPTPNDKRVMEKRYYDSKSVTDYNLRLRIPGVPTRRKSIQVAELPKTTMCI